MASNYEILIQKLDEFIRKYYKNQLIRGLIYSGAVFLAFYLTLVVLEHFGHFGTGVRTGLFWSFVVTNAVILGRLVVMPLLQLNKIGQVISHEQASDIIGKHFPDISDKLLNTLQLHRSSESVSGSTSVDLVNASINQRISELQPVPFVAAIDLKKNRKHLKYLVVPALVFVVMLFAAPNMINNSTARLVEHGKYFEQVAPFQFVIENENLQAIQHEDYELSIKLEGDEIPAETYVVVDDNRYKLGKQSTIRFKHIFKNVQKSFKFQLFADGFYSKEYELNALPNPVVLNFQILVDYPAYTGKKDETINNSGDLLVPAGTKLNWVFRTKDTRELKLSFIDTSIAVNRKGENEFEYSRTLLRNTSYAISASNEFLKSKDSITYQVNVIPDLYPSIDIEEVPDSLSSKKLYFNGTVKDDYGFKKLTFNYSYVSKKDTNGNASGKNEVEIFVNKDRTLDNFFHYWDLAQLGITPGDEIEYYFEIWDNDGVSGSKSTRSIKKVYKAPTLKELSEKTEEQNKNIKKELSEAIKEAQSLQKQMKNMQEKLLDKKNLNWEDKKTIRDMLDKQKNLENKIENLKQENQKKNNERAEFKPLEEEILEKQKKLEEMFDEIMTDEMKKLFEEMEKLLEELNKDKAKEMLEEMEVTNEDISKELDKTMELFKQLEFEQKLDETIEKLDDLAEKQEELSKESENKDASNEELEEKQEELNKEFEDIQKDMDDLEKKNSELERPNKMEDTEQQEQDIQQEMQQSQEQLQNQKNNKASQSQKNASQKMKNLSQQMQQMQMQMQQQGASEDINALRRILENLLQLSFDQENLIGEVKKTHRNDPNYVNIAREQQKLKDDAKLVEDSLFALSKRVIQLETIVNREIREINHNMDESIQDLADRQTHKAAGRQQFTLTSINNLALLLSEVVEQMQQQMAQQMMGNSSCNKPGSSMPSAATMKQMQEQLNKQIEKLRKGMQQQKGEGKKPGQGMLGGMSKELAKMAAQQEAIRQMLQEYNQQNNKDGKGSHGDLEKLQELMEETETDLVNKMINQETLMRQQEILTRLLEAEKAERERDEEERRQSKEAKNEDYSNPELFFEYKRRKQKEVELLKTVPPSLNPFYREKVNDYFNNFEDSPK